MVSPHASRSVLPQKINSVKRTGDGSLGEEVACEEEGLSFGGGVEGEFGEEGGEGVRPAVDVADGYDARGGCVCLNESIERENKE